MSQFKGLVEVTGSIPAGTNEIGKVQVSGLKEQSTQIISSTSTSIAAGGSEVIDIYSPSGFMDEFDAVFFVVGAPGGAGSGSHDLDIFKVTGGVVIPLLYSGAVAYNNFIKHDYGYWTGAGVNKLPPDNIMQLQVIKGVSINADSAIRFNYRNLTNVATTQIRNYYLSTKRKAVI